MTLDFPIMFPELSSDRLLLRAISIKDIDFIFKLRSNPVVSRFIKRDIWHSLDQSREFTQHKIHGFSKRQFIFWVISLQKETKPIGTICLWNFDPSHSVSELGYELLPKYQNAGIMTESLGLVLQYARLTLNLNRVSAYTHYKNTASIHLLKKHHFQLNNTIKDPGFPNNIIYDLYLNSNRHD